jgi:hypothetical protein
MAKVQYFLGGPNQSLLNDGTPNSGGSIEFWYAGTSDHVDTYPTYDDAIAGTNANTNPVELDAYGRAEIWVVGAVKFQVYDSADVAVGDPVDDFNGEDTNSGTVDADDTSMIANGSFEAWTNGEPDNITVSEYTGAVVSQETADTYDGASAIKCIANGNGGATYQWDDYFPVSPGYEYLAEFMLKNTTGTTNIVCVKWYDEAQDPLPGADAYTDVYNNTTTHTNWTRKYGFVTPPADARYGRFYAVAADPSGLTSGTVRMDGCRLVVSTRNVNDLAVDDDVTIGGDLAVTGVGTFTAQPIALAGVQLGNASNLNQGVEFYPVASSPFTMKCVGYIRINTGTGAQTRGGCLGTGTLAYANTLGAGNVTVVSNMALSNPLIMCTVQDRSAGSYFAAADYNSGSGVVHITVWDAAGAGANAIVAVMIYECA